MVLAGLDGWKEFRVVGRWRIRVKDLMRTVGGKPKMAEILCTDAHRTYAALARKYGLQHKVARSHKRARVLKPISHVQHAKQMASYGRTWNRRFHRVATNYLQNYLTWPMLGDTVKHHKQNLSSFATALFSWSHVCFT